MKDALDTALAPTTTTIEVNKTPNVNLLSFSSDLYLCEIHSPSFQSSFHSALAAYVFWSTFTALIPSLFYFSVWELGIAGQELALLVTLSPILLGIPPFKEWAYSKEGRSILRGLSLVGLAAFVSKSPVVRLFLVTFANFAASLGAAVEWFGGNQEDVAYGSFGAS